MLRIDLLPPGIRQARRARKLIPFAAGAVVLTAVAVFLYAGTLAPQKKAAEDRAAKAQAKVQEQQQEINKIKDEAQQALAEVDPALRVARFCRQFETFNSQWPDIIEAVARYTWNEATLSSISVSSNSVTVSTTVRDTEALARFLFNFERCRMPAEGGGTEPLWSSDSVSVKDLKPTFSGPIQVSTSLGGASIEGTGGGRGAGAGMPGPAGAPGMPGAPPGLGAAAGGGGGAVQYRGGLLYIPQISVTVTATLAKPISLEPLAQAAAAGVGAPAGGMPGMGYPGMGAPGMPTAPGMGGAPAAGKAGAGKAGKAAEEE